jgi:hypothetical protein
MVVRYDGKGKFYTDVISKEKVPATIQTLKHRVHGNVHIRPDNRLKDELNQSPRFLAVTEAEVYSDNDEVIYRTHFMTINLEHIVWLLPDHECVEDDAPAEGDHP